MLNVTFHGVRASAPTAGQARSRYGVHGRCVALEAPRGDAILLDLGTGVARWAATVEPDEPARAHALLTRAHPDHLAGMRLFDGEVLGPLPGHDGDGRRWAPVEDSDVAVGDAEVAVRPVPHPERVNGYRVEWRGVRVAYVAVADAPGPLGTVALEVLDLADGVDLLIHDGSDDEYALRVAGEAGVRILALSGHRPDKDDDSLDRLLLRARRSASRLGVDEVLVATEGTTVSFGGGGR